MATQLTKPSPGHHLIDTLHDYIDTIKRSNQNLNITFKWIPGCKGVEGNEAADEQAKKAITDGSSNATHIPTQLHTPIPHSKSALIRTHNKLLNRKAQKAWTKSLRYSRMRKTDPTAPSKAYLKLIAGTPRHLASILTQLRTGHVPLAKYLHRIKKTDSPTCPACHQGTESMHHFILHCPAHKAARQKLCNETGGRSLNLAKLLTTAETLPAFLNFVVKSGCFHKHGNNTTPAT
jgi:hypothetical protein